MTQPGILNDHPRPVAHTVVGALALVMLASPGRGAVARTGQMVMGTVLEVAVVAADLRTAQRLAGEAIAEARRWDDVLTTWRPEGELARLNARAGTGAITVSDELAAVLRRMQQLSEVTGGAFDPAVGPLVDLWRTPTPPAPAVLARIGPCRIAAVVTLRNREVVLARGAALDAGGIGKGVALDAIAELLRGGGAQAAFLDFGGSSQLGLGAPPDSPRGWQVAVTGLAPGTVHGTVFLRDAALSTSRTTGAGVVTGPVVDPRTGKPVEGPRVATVLGPDATTAEAWSTALVVLGRRCLTRLTRAGLQALVEDRTGVERTRGFTLQALRPSRDASPDTGLPPVERPPNAANR